MSELKIIGKIDLDADKTRKLNKFRKKLIEIMDKGKSNPMPLGKVLHKADKIKANLKMMYAKYIIPPEERTNDNDNFDWLKFFDENLYPEFEIEKDYYWNNSQVSDALHYHPQAKTKNVENKNNDNVNNAKQNVIANEATSNTELESSETTNVKNAKQELKMTQEDINKQIKTLLEELNNGLYEKERSIRLTLLAVLAGESTFMLGEPGTAKSLIARRISEAFEDIENEDEIKFFDYLMNQFSTPEEIFGPVSINELKIDKYIRKTEKYLPKAQFAFLDEIWKANPAIQNTLLTILNEKIFRNGVQVEKVPLIGFMSASNELPEKGKGLEAIFDRFLVRILEKPIAGNDNFRSMISAKRNVETKITKKLTKSIIDTILKESENVEISDECFKIIDSVRKSLVKRNEEIKEENEKYQVSDRRWKKIANLMRVSAYCNNRKETDLMDATLIADCIWSTEQQEEEAKLIISEIIKIHGVRCNTNYKDLKKTVDAFKDQINENFYETIKTKDVYEEKLYNSVDYYKVYNLNNQSDVCYISKNKTEYNMYYTKGEFKVNGRYTELTARRITAEFDESSMIYTLNNGDKYKVVVKILGETKLQKRDLPPQAKQAVINSFDKKFSSIDTLIKNEIQKINYEVKDQENQYNSNLFTDSNKYYDVVFQEQIQVKTDLNNLLVDLKNLRKRYQ